MIATTPVARWAWGRDDDTADDLTRCLHEVLAALTVLTRHRLAAAETVVRVSVKEAGVPNSHLFRGEFTVKTDEASRVEAVARLADQVRAGMRIGEVGAVDASVACCGSLVTERGEEWQEGLFLLGASAFADFVTVDLVTYSDAWLPCDLKGRPQPEVYSANGPRLSAALNELAEVLGLETDPDDPTYFAKPTETGAENFLGPDGNASDVWRSFEVPSRYDVFTHAPGFGRIGYRRTAEGDVSFVPVENEHGIIGFLWASDEESAASFEPQDVGDDLVHRAGLGWLARLHSAHERGLTPSAALDELSRLPDEEGAGHVVTSDRPRTADLRVLRESVSND